VSQDTRKTMVPRESAWPWSSVMLALTGAALVAMGLYFILLRPPLLPEDVRYIGLSLERVTTAAPKLQSWLTQVFRVLGGYILASGALTITLAASPSFRAHNWGAAIAALIAGMASIGLMTVVNFRIDSDFKWMLFAVGLVWLSSLCLFGVEKAHDKRRDR
jgi:steroid 5-alpha reductase family enzyme